jgi:SAM-dependent methyltransferase
VCATAYPPNGRFGFPRLLVRSAKEAKEDRYEDPKNRHAERYGGLWAFGYHFLGRGEAEGFYRTLSELVLSIPFSSTHDLRILEVGCGVARTACDVARRYPEATVVAADISQRMLEQAYAILVGDPPGATVKVALEQEGFGTVSASSFGLSNVHFAQANAVNLPFASGQFDVVISANVVDRLPSPEHMFREAARVLKPNGYLVFADPFNWSKLPEWWSRCPSLGALLPLLTGHGFQPDVAFDMLVYRELTDARGAYADWPVAVVRAAKRR